MQATLHHVAQKIKGQSTLIILGSIICLLCVSSFALGYVYRVYSQKDVLVDSGVKVEYPPYVTDMMKNGSYAILGINNSSKGNLTGDLRVSEGESDTALTSELESTSGSFAASQNGTVYYPVGCSALSRVQPENRIYFSSSAEAETLGYTLSKSCD